LSAGNTVIALASETRPMPALLSAECAATSDAPAGVFNVVTGRVDEVGPALASHEDVDGLDLAGAGRERATLAATAAQTITRVVHSRDDEDFLATPSTARLRAFIETTTVWHTIGQ
jgi:acyl-CoA reductase-like NAD-dependent aldehyde dehydrogenase